MDSRQDMHATVKGWVFPAITLGCLILMSWIVIHWDLDRSIAARFYSPSRGWYLAKQQPWYWLYKYGTIPGMVLAIVSLTAWLICLLKTSLLHLHRYFLVIVLTAVIGPGVLVNGVLKNYWGRPRPRQVQEFGGQWEYRHLTQPGTPGRGESFTCGHCTMGFLFCSLLVFRRKNKWLAYSGTVTGLLLGGLLGVARMVQGAHFLSDVFWSMGIVAMVIMALNGLFIRRPATRAAKPMRLTRSKRYLTGGLILLSIAALSMAFLMHRPFYKEHRHPLEVAAGLETIELNTTAAIAKIRIDYEDVAAGRMLVIARGFGWTGAKHRLQQRVSSEAGKMIVELRVDTSGYFAELSHECIIVLPKYLENRVKVKLAA